MKLDLKRLKDAPGRVFPVAAAFSLDSLLYKGRPLALKRNIGLSGEASYKSGVVYFSMKLTSVIELECSRCLKRFAAPMVIEETIEFKGEAQEAAGGSTAGSKLPQHEGFTYEAGAQELELLPYLKSLMLTHLDPKPLCKADCKGLCPQCGRDFNEGPCGCETEKVADPRLEKLKEFFQ